MVRRTLRLSLLFVGVALSCAGPAAIARNPNPSAGAQGALVPIRAQLVGNLNAKLLQADQPVFAKVEEEWSGQGCLLRQDALLKGRILSASLHQNKQPSEVSVLFESAECGGPGLKPLALTLAAVLAPESDHAQDHYVPLSEAIGLAPAGGIRGAGSAAAIAVFEPRQSRPLSIQPGTVYGIAQLKLRVGTGPEASSVLYSSARNVQLESRSVLVLVQGAAATLTKAVGKAAVAPPTAVAVASTPVAAVVPMLSDAETCSPPACSVVTTQISGEIAAPEKSLSLTELGFAVRPRQEMYRFDHDAAVAWLGPKELLITFNPHVLVTRDPGSDAAGRTIRAVLVELPGLTVKRSLQWRVPDSRQYLWLAGQGRVLAQVGNDLRLYGPGLKLEKKIELNAPLAFVQVSPSSTYFAIGLVHERHSQEVHQQLKSASDSEPEEDIEIREWNEQFQQVASTTRSSKYAPPTLLDEGEVTLRSTGKQQYRIVEMDWSQRVSTIANLKSTCVPEMSSLPGDLLFLLSCGGQPGAKLYRVVRPNGSLLLKGSSSSAAVAHLAIGNDRQSAFAVAVADLEHALASGTAFLPAELSDEHLTVYKTVDGKRLFGTEVKAPVPSQQAFALSPDGDQLAVVADGRLVVYSMK